MSTYSKQQQDDDLRGLLDAIAEYARKYPEQYALHVRDRERESEAERWGDSDDGGALCGFGPPEPWPYAANCPHPEVHQPENDPCQWCKGSAP